MPAHLTVGSTYSGWCTALRHIRAGEMIIVIGVYEDPAVSGGWRNVCLTCVSFASAAGLLAYEFSDAQLGNVVGPSCEHLELLAFG